MSNFSKIRTKSYGTRIIPPIVSTVVPSVTGTNILGGVLTVTLGTWSHGFIPTTVTYQWKRDGVNISGATNTTYTITQSDFGKNITCSVNASDGYNSGSGTSANYYVYTIYSYDSFTAANDTVLTSRSGELGATWTLQAGTCNNLPKIQDNRLYSLDAGTLFRMSGSPASANYEVYAKFTARSTLISTDNVGIMIRAVGSTSNTFYLVRYSKASNSWALFKYVSGTITSWLSYSDTILAGESRDVILRANGSNISVLINGVVVITQSDSAITGAGFAGIRIPVVQTNSTGIHIDFILSRELTG